MYTEETKKELAELKDLHERIGRLKDDLEIYKNDESYTESLMNNINKLQGQYNKSKEIILKRYEITSKQLKDGFAEKTEKLWGEFNTEKDNLLGPYSKKLQEYDERIDRLKGDLQIYKNDESYSKSVLNNIERLKVEKQAIIDTEGKEIKETLASKEVNIKKELKQREENIENRMEEIRIDLENVGIEVKKFELIKKDDKIEKDAKQIKKDSRLKRIVKAITSAPGKAFRFITNKIKAVGRKTKDLGRGGKVVALTAGKVVSNTAKNVAENVKNQVGPVAKELKETENVKREIKAVEKSKDLDDEAIIEEKRKIYDNSSKETQSTILRNDFKVALRENRAYDIANQFDQPETEPIQRKEREEQRRENLHMGKEQQQINHEEAIEKVEGEILTPEEVKNEEQEK